MESLTSLPASVPGLFDPSLSIKVVEVAKKYEEPEGQPILRIPEYTTPGGPNSYRCSKIETSWTQGFFPGLLWLLVERRRLLPNSVEGSYDEAELIKLARRWQADFEYLKRPSENHDQGFRFQLSYGKDFGLTGNQHAKEVVLDAAESLVDRYSEGAGCIRSWDKMNKSDGTKYPRENKDEHYLVIIDNMANEPRYAVPSIRLVGDEKYAKIANRQAEKSMETHVRPNGTTYHVVNMDQKTGKPLELMTHQGYSDESCWSRGQAWGIYGYAQCALRTGRADFLATARKLADVFVSLLPESGVPWWDFDAPKPCPYDASAGTIAARGMQMLYQLLLETDKAAAERYLAAGFKLIDHILRECGTPAATLSGGKVDWGKDEWETLLMHATINANDRATRRLVDHGLVYADYYLVEFGNEALKL